MDLRGNVPTRLRKLADAATYDAILLAEAGLVRLNYLPAIAGTAAETITGMPDLHVQRLDETVFFPAAGQGAVGLEIRSNDGPSRACAEAIGHRPTWLRVTAEREFLRLLDAGCHTPVGVFSTLDGEELQLQARVFPESGGLPRTGTTRGPAAEPLLVAHNLFLSLK